MAVLLSALGTLLLLMAMLSYSPQDGGWSAASGAQVNNAVGVVGAGVADLLVHAFGYLAYTVPFLVLLKLWLLYRRRQTASNWVWSLRLLGILYVMSSACGIAELSIWEGKDLPMGAGGMLGMAVASSIGYLLGLAGTVVTLVVLMALGLMLFLEFSWLEFFETLGERVDAFMNRRRAAAELAEKRAEDAHIPLFIPEPEGPIVVPVPPVVNEQVPSFSAVDQPPASERFTAMDDEPKAVPVPERRVAPKHAEPSLGDIDSLFGTVDVDEPVMAASAPIARRPVTSPPPSESVVAPATPVMVPIIRAEGSLRTGAAMAGDEDYPPMADDRVATHVDVASVAMAPRPVVSDPSLFRTTYQSVGQRVRPQLTDSDSDLAEPVMVNPAPDVPAVHRYEAPRQSEMTPVPRAEAVTAPVTAQVSRESLLAVPAFDDDEDDSLPWSANDNTREERPALERQAPVFELPEEDDEPYDVLADEEELPLAQPLTASAMVPVQPLEKKETSLSERAQRDMSGKVPVHSPLPSIAVLDPPRTDNKGGFSEERLQELSRLLVQKLADFGVKIEVVAVAPGPVITRFEIQPAPGVKASKITNLAKDLARSMAMISVRVVEVIPGKSVMGIEVPNEDRAIVSLFEVLSSTEFDNVRSPLALALGHDIGGNPVITDLAKMPHLLVAGTTGSGKSVGVNAMILSMLFKATPEQLRLIMVDPKMLELSVYEGIPHLLTPVITDMKEAANGLRWSVAEMERRYQLLAAVGVRNIASYNRKVQEAIDAGTPMLDPTWQLHLSYDTTPRTLKPLPYIVIVIDEFADMMMMVGKKVEELIARIAQKARAAGIHMILATQRPSVDVITGLIKANIPTRISFQVSSRIDSRTILDQGGAEQLLGHGDMLYMPPGLALPERVHGAFVDDDEVHRVVAEWKLRGEPNYLEEIVQTGEEGAAPAMGEGGDEQDELFDEAVAFVTSTGKCSTSAVQRKLRIGYNRAARLVDSMEAAGVVSAPAHNGAREVLAPPPPDLR